jgi:hypothetical protein
MLTVSRKRDKSLLLRCGRTDEAIGSLGTWIYIVDTEHMDYRPGRPRDSRLLLVLRSDISRRNVPGESMPRIISMPSVQQRERVDQALRSMSIGKIRELVAVLDASVEGRGDPPHNGPAYSALRASRSVE